MNDHRTARRLVIREEWRALLRPITPGRAPNATAAEPFEHSSLILDLSSRGAAVRVGSDARPDLPVGDEIMVGLQPTPTTEFRWLRTRVANHRPFDNGTLIVGLRWIPCRENEDTMGILATYVVEEGLRRAWATGRTTTVRQRSTVNFLVVANWSLGDQQLGDRLVEMAQQAEPATFHLAVPVVQPPTGVISDERRCALEAAERLELMIKISRRIGLSIDGQVVGKRPDVDPAAAALAALVPGHHHRVLVSTFQPSIPSWQTKGIIDDLRTVCRLPVERIECDTFAALDYTERFRPWASSHGLRVSSG